MFHVRVGLWVLDVFFLCQMNIKRLNATYISLRITHAAFCMCYLAAQVSDWQVTDRLQRDITSTAPQKQSGCSFSHSSVCPFFCSVWPKQVSGSCSFERKTIPRRVRSLLGGGCCFLQFLSCSLWFFVFY